MFIIGRKSEVRIRKNVVNNIQEDIADAILKGFSFDFLEVTNFQQKFRMDYHLVYYVFDGELFFEINKGEYFLQKGDAVFVEKGMSYEMKGTFKAVAINRTAYV